jgi:hypothetical protein
MKPPTTREEAEEMIAALIEAGVVKEYDRHTWWIGHLPFRAAPRVIQVVGDDGHVRDVVVEVEPAPAVSDQGGEAE